jgi:hypothetical protein
VRRGSEAAEGSAMSMAVSPEARINIIPTNVFGYQDFL